MIITTYNNTMHGRYFDNNNNNNIYNVGQHFLQRSPFPMHSHALMTDL
jgi:hypothetical protein